MTPPLKMNRNSLNLDRGKDSYFEAQMKLVFKAFLKPKTMKEVAVQTNIDRSNITWYLRQWKRSEVIWQIRKGRCPITGRVAGFWTTDRQLVQADQLKIGLK